MTDPDRIAELEAQLAFQEGTIETLNASLVAMREQTDALERRLAALESKLKGFDSSAVGRIEDEPPPPHY
jgi:SlyX protein